MIYQSQSLSVCAHKSVCDVTAIDNNARKFDIWQMTNGQKEETSILLQMLPLNKSIFIERVYSLDTDNML